MIRFKRQNWRRTWQNLTNGCISSWWTKISSHRIRDLNKGMMQWELYWISLIQLWFSGCSSAFYKDIKFTFWVAQTKGVHQDYGLSSSLVSHMLLFSAFISTGILKHKKVSLKRNRIATSTESRQKLILIKLNGSLQHLIEQQLNPPKNNRRIANILRCSKKIWLM